MTEHDVAKIAEGPEHQAVWRCALSDAVHALDLLKNEWLESRRKAEREAGARLAPVLDLIYSFRNPAPTDYEQAFTLGKKLHEAVRQHLEARHDR